MNAYPVTGANITQTLFKQNEQLVVPGDSVSVAYQNLASLSGINSMPQEIDNMKELMPAYLNQAHLSTYYQDNPYDTLLYSSKFGVPVPGGNIDPNQPPGHRPGNTYVKYSQNMKNSNNYPSVVTNMKKSQIMRENFENVNWQ